MFKANPFSAEFLAGWAAGAPVSSGMLTLRADAGCVYVHATVSLWTVTAFYLGVSALLAIFGLPLLVAALLFVVAWTIAFLFAFLRTRTWLRRILQQAPHAEKGVAV
jgi:hypothetical protein